MKDLFGKHCEKGVDSLLKILGVDGKIFGILILLFLAFWFGGIKFLVGFILILIAAKILTKFKEFLRSGNINYLHLIKYLTGIITLSVVCNALFSILIKYSYLIKNQPMITHILPTWDLLIVIFFIIITIYSTIVGRNTTTKIIVATYIAILATDGLGYLLETGLDKTNPELLLRLIILKISALFLIILFITAKGKFSVDYGRDDSIITLVATNSAFGFLSAGLIISTILVYIGGGNIINTANMNIYSGSSLASVIVENYYLWITLPIAAAFILMSLTEEDGK